MERERFRKMDIDRKLKFETFKLCECGSRMAVIQGCEHLAAFHPQIVTLVKKISEKVNSFPDIKKKYPSMDCRNLCAAKAIANRLIENLTKYDRSSLDLIQQLSEKITNTFDINFISDDQRNCNLCGLLFPVNSFTVTHLMIRHQECLALMQFLRCFPLSALNFPQELIRQIDNSPVSTSFPNKTKLQKLIKQITNSAVRAKLRRQYAKKEKPCVTKEKKNKKCITKKKKNKNGITKEFFKMEENTRTLSLFDARPNPRLNAINAEVMQKIRETAENSPFPYTSNITDDIAPENNLKTPQGNSERHFTSCVCDKNAKSETLPTNSKIDRYGKDKMDRLIKQQEKEKILKKEKTLKNVLVKCHEKETTKEVLYCKKMLTKYVTQHRHFLFKLESNLINVQKWVTSRQCSERLLEKVNFYVTNDEVKKTVTYLLKKLFVAMKDTKKDMSDRHIDDR